MPEPAAPIPRATYRLQFHAGFGFRGCGGARALSGAARHQPRLRLALSEGAARQHARLRHRRPRPAEPRARRRAGLSTRMVAALRGERARADPRLRAEPYGRGRRRQSVVAGRAGMGSGFGITPAGSTSIGSRTGAICSRSCWCRSWATSTARCWKPASSRCGSTPDSGQLRGLGLRHAQAADLPAALRARARRRASGAGALGRRVLRACRTGGRRSRSAPRI